MSIDPIKLVLDVQAKNSQVLDAIEKRLQALEKQVAATNGELAKTGGKDIQQGIGTLNNSLQGLLFQYNNLTFAVRNFAGQTTAAFQQALGPAAQLQDQILGIATAVASSQKVFQNGVEIKDPTQAIKALQPEVEAAIKTIQQGALLISNTTTSEILPTFQSIAQVSSQVGINLDQAAKLSLKLTAAAKTFNTPINEIQGQIQRILTASIDTTDTFAKNLGLSRSQLQLYKEQGVLVEKLEQRLAAAAAGNKLGAENFGNVISNIQEFIDVLRLELGKPLLGPITQQLNELYGFLSANQDNLVKGITTALDEIGSVVGPIFNEIKQVVAGIFNDSQRIFQENQQFFEDFAKSAGTIAKDGVIALVNAIDLLLSVQRGIAESPLVKLVGGFLLGKLQDLSKSITAISQGLQLVNDLSKPLLANITQLFNDVTLGFQKTLGEGLLKAFQSIPQPIIKALTQIGLLPKDLEASLQSLAETGSATFNRIGNDAQAGFATIGESAKKAVTTGAKEIEKLGSTAEQLANKVNGAFNRIKNPLSADDFQAANRELIDLTNQQVALGQITQEEAERRLESIRTDARVSIDTQQNAIKTAQQLREQAGSQELADIKARQTQIEALQRSGQISELEGVKQLTAVKEEELNKRLELTREAIERELVLTNGANSPRLAQLRATEKEQAAAIIQARVEARKQIAQAELSAIATQQVQTKAAIADGQLSELDGEKRLTELKVQEFRKRIDAAVKGSEERKKLEAELQQFLDDTENRQSELRLKRFDAAQRKALDLAKEIESERLIAQQELINQGVLREAEAASERLAIQRDTISKELELAQQRVDELERLPKPDGEAEVRAREEQIRSEKQKTFELTIRLLDNQRQQQKQFIADLEQAQKRQTDAFSNAIQGQTLNLQQQQLVTDSITKSIDAQNRLLEVRKGLNDSFFNLAETELSLLEKTATTEEEKQELAKATALIKFRALQQQNELEKQSLELQLQQEQAALRRQQIENRIAQLKNQADVAKAQANIKTTEAKVKAGLATPEELQAAQLELQAQQQTGVSLQLQGFELNRQEAIQTESANARRLQQGLKTRESERVAAFDLAAQTPGVENERNLFRQQLLQNLGVGNISNLGFQNQQQVRGILQQLLGQQQLAIPLNDVIAGRATTLRPDLQIPQAAPAIVPVTSVLPSVSSQPIQSLNQPVQGQDSAGTGSLFTEVKTCREVLLEIWGEITPLAADVVQVSQQISGLKGGVTALANTPRSLTLVNQEKQSIADSLAEQGRLIAQTANL